APAYHRNDQRLALWGFRFPEILNGYAEKQHHRQQSEDSMLGEQARKLGVSRRLRRLRREFQVVSRGLARAYAKKRVLLEGFQIGERQLVAPCKFSIDQAFGQRALGEFVQLREHYEVD